MIEGNPELAHVLRVNCPNETRLPQKDELMFPAAKQCFCLVFFFLTEEVCGMPKKGKERVIGAEAVDNDSP